MKALSVAGIRVALEKVLVGFNGTEHALSML